LSVLTGVLWYSTAQKWSPCYQKVHANRVRVIRRHLYIKPRTFNRAKKICLCNPRVCVKRVRVNEVLLYHARRYTSALLYLFFTVELSDKIANCRQCGSSERLPLSTGHKIGHCIKFSVSVSGPSQCVSSHSHQLSRTVPLLVSVVGVESKCMMH